MSDDIVAPTGAVYIPPKAVEPKPVEKWPRFVWCAHPHRNNVAQPSIWHYRCSTGRIMVGRPEYQPTLYEHELTDEELALDIKFLARLYPPPAGYRSS